MLLIPKTTICYWEKICWSQRLWSLESVRVQFICRRVVDGTISGVATITTAARKSCCPRRGIVRRSW